MNRLTMTATACAAGLMLITSGAFAQNTKTKERTDTRSAQKERTNRQQAKPRSRAGSLDKKTTGSNLRVSQLIGMNIQNTKGESLGEIHDVVVDTSNYKVKYAAVSYGGFLNLGDKLFAVPIEAIECKQNPEDRDEHILVMNVTQKQLEGAQGFNEDSWPNFADPKFTDSLDKRYGVERTERRGAAFRKGQEKPDVDVDVDLKQPNEKE